MSGKNELREQLAALVGEVPEVPSPAPLVIAKVRRSRRRRQAVGALAVVAAVTGGVLVGVNPFRQRAVEPAAPEPQRLCRAELPPVWAHALEPGVFRISQGTVLAASPDGRTVFVQEGRQVVQLGHSGRRVVMSLPGSGASQVEGSVEGDWFAFGVRGADLFYSAVFAWNIPTGQLRQVPAAKSQVISSWTLGPQYLAWESGVSPAPGGIGDQQRHVMRLSDGATRQIADMPLFYAGEDSYTWSGDRGTLTAADAWSQSPATVPAALAAAFHVRGSMGSQQADGTFSWSAGNNSATTGPAAQDVWDSRTGTLSRVPAPAGEFVQGVTPIGAGYAIAEFALKGHKETAQSELIDVRNHSYAPLTEAQASVLSDGHHAIPLTELSRLPGCGG